MSNELDFISLFSGIGCFDTALEAEGWTCKAQVEKDAKASSILARHSPDVPNLGDIHHVGRHNLPPVILAGLTGVVPEIPRGGWRSAGIAFGPFYNIAWRILDARYFGVAQRRRRVFIVGCERLQGLPDGYTAFGKDGEPMSDSTRYQTLGNGGAVPVMRWIARRIRAAIEGTL